MNSGQQDVLPEDTTSVARRAPYALPWHKVDDLSPMQVTGMQSVDDARREGVLTEAQADELFAMVRDGRVHGARKRLTEARKRTRTER